MKLKFKPGQKVQYKGEELEIKIARKEFRNKKILYRMTNGTEVYEDDLERENKKAVKKNKAEDKKLETVRAQYKAIIGKEVVSQKKNDIAWMEGKITAAKEEAEKHQSEAKYKALAALDFGQLVTLVEEEKIDAIDVSDYENAPDLLEAICEELKIEVPEE